VHTPIVCDLRRVVEVDVVDDIYTSGGIFLMEVKAAQWRDARSPNM
jgi:hypothetical protein